MSVTHLLACQITKRDGSEAPFDPERISGAVSRCFASVGVNGEAGNHLVRQITTRVINTLFAQKKEQEQKEQGETFRPTVEDVQRAVIQQLWADGLYEAAEHYTLYREERRRKREERPVDPEHLRLIQEDQVHFPTQLQYYQFVSKYARWDEAKGRRETWRECCDRVFRWFATTPGWNWLEREEQDWLYGMMYEFKASPAMRIVQMAGPALERCHSGAYNCSYVAISDLFSFSELLYVLMQGCGAGFSVEGEYIDQLPRVQKQKKLPAEIYVVEDSTEGWCDALKDLIIALVSGRDLDIDYSQIRPKDTPLKTKGGYASGPEPLRRLLEFVRKIVLSRQGKRLTDIDCHDIACFIGKIVQVGGVRRASEISLSDQDSVTMRMAKHGNWWLENSQRAMANNSAVYEERPTVDQFMVEWLALMQSRSGERGIFNREAAVRNRPKRRKKWRFGGNPCGEILLRSRQFCNLSIAVLRPTDSLDEVREKLRAAVMFGTLQACCTNFLYLRKEWRENCEEERLLGVDIMGHLDHPLLCPPGNGEARERRRKQLEELRDFAVEENRRLAERMGIAPSAAVTCLKPGGNSGVFFGSSSLSPWFAEYQIRRTRESASGPVARMLIDQGVPHEIAPEDGSLLAFAWPKRNPAGCLTRDKVGAIEQLENWLDWKECWTEHNPSVTIYVRDEEWLDVGAWVWRNFDRIGGLSFLPYDNGTYQAVPNEQITEERWRELDEAFPTIDWSKLVRYEVRDQTESRQTLACTGDVCEVG